jgi:hypothetical protein
MRILNSWFLPGSMLLGIILWSLWPSLTELLVTPKEPLVKQWLEAMRKGGDGFEYWTGAKQIEQGYTDEGLPPRVTFYAVSDYEILDNPDHGTWMVRIHSSTLAGIPVVRVYEVMVSSVGIYRVTAQGEDPHAWITEGLKSGQ